MAETHGSHGVTWRAAAKNQSWALDKFVVVVKDRPTRTIWGRCPIGSESTVRLHSHQPC